MRLQHRHRRDGGITVGSTRYALDEAGVVDVTEEHAARLLQGRDWRSVSPEGRMPWTEPPPAPEMPVGGAGRRPRTREELAGLADIAGVPMPVEGPKGFDQFGRIIKPPDPEASDQVAAELAETIEIPSAVDPADEESEETIEVSAVTPKAQLLQVCGRLGIKPPSGANKAQLLALLQQAQ